MARRRFPFFFRPPDPEKNYLPSTPGETLGAATGGAMGPCIPTVCAPSYKKNQKKIEVVAAGVERDGRLSAASGHVQGLSPIHICLTG